VLYLGRDEVLSCAFCHGDPVDHHVVRFGRSAREDDLRGFASQEERQPLPRLFDARPDRNTEAVAARGVAELLLEIGQHLVEHHWIDGRAGVIVEIDAVHGFLF
jgi:hypothetical protein